MSLIAPFPYFGGKRMVTEAVWRRLGSPAQYIEPFCGSAAMLLAAPKVASLEVVCDGSGFIANFWRAVKYQPAAVAEWADYPVSHIDLGARHRWLMDQRERLGDAMQDCDWPGDAKVAGWWLWGQCSWIGSGWCDWARQQRGDGDTGGNGQVPHASSAGRGIQAVMDRFRTPAARGGGYRRSGRFRTPATRGGAMKPYSHRLAEPHGSGCTSSRIDLNVSASFTATGPDASTIILAVMIPLCFLIRRIGRMKSSMAFRRRSRIRLRPGRERTRTCGSRSAAIKATTICRDGTRLNGRAGG